MREQFLARHEDDQTRARNWSEIANCYALARAEAQRRTLAAEGAEPGNSRTKQRRSQADSRRPAGSFGTRAGESRRSRGSTGQVERSGRDLSATGRRTDAISQSFGTKLGLPGKTGGHLRTPAPVARGDPRRSSNCSSTARKPGCRKIPSCGGSNRRWEACMRGPRDRKSPAAIDRRLGLLAAACRPPPAKSRKR